MSKKMHFIAFFGMMIVLVLSACQKDGASPENSYIIVDTPATGADWYIGNTYIITWHSINGNTGSQVAIQLWQSGSITLVINSITTNDESYSWNIPSSVSAGSNYRIEVTSTTVEGAEGFSGDFTIEGGGTPDIIVDTPTDGASWSIGSTDSITWHSINGNTGSQVAIQLLQGSSIILEITAGTSNDGFYSWNLPSSLPTGSNYQIAVTSTTVEGADGLSGFFTIESGGTPDIIVDTPAAGANWSIGSTDSITWHSINGNTGSQVAIQLRQGSSIIVEITAATTNDGSYSWNIPSSVPTGSNYQIEVSSTTVEEADGLSGNFTIEDIGTPDIIVDTPATGVDWHIGSTYTITWHSINGNTGSQVVIQLWQTDSMILVIKATTTNDGSYSWTIPLSVSTGSNYRIEVTSATVEGADGFSGYFTIN